MEPDGLCQYLDWDSNFFEKRIARVTITQLTKKKVKNINIWCKENGIDCLYFLTDATDGKSIRLAEDNGYRLVDIRVVFEKQNAQELGTENSFEGVIRPSTTNDIPALRSIAKIGFRNATRFYYDDNFPKERCDAMYEIWIEKSCNGSADVVLVSETHGLPCGFITCECIDSDCGEIGLVGVNRNWQGIGLGQGLIKEALRWFKQMGVSRIKVVTQGRNSQAQRLYQRCGFLTVSVELWYHKWF